MTIEEIKAKKRHGDNIIIGNILGINPDSIYHLLRSKHESKKIQIIEEFERLFNERGDLRKCSKCQKLKNNEEFYADNSSKARRDKLTSKCIDCCSEKRKKDYSANKNRYLDYAKIYKRNNPQIIIEQHKRAARRFVDELLPYYLRQRLKKTGVPINEETLSIQKTKIQLHRIRKNSLNHITNGKQN